jgi:hypothetical protein
MGVWHQQNDRASVRLCGTVATDRHRDTLRLPHSATVARLNNLLGYCGSVALWLFCSVAWVRLGSNQIIFVFGADI